MNARMLYHANSQTSARWKYGRYSLSGVQVLWLARKYGSMQANSQHYFVVKRLDLTL